MSKKQLQMMILIQNLVLAFVINSAATILNGGIQTPGSYLLGMFMAFSINYIALWLIPVVKIGQSVADGLRLKAGKLPHKLVRIFVINAIFVTIISFSIAMLNLGLTEGLVGIWWSTYPILHLVGYITSVLIEKPAMELAQVLVDTPDSQVSH